MPTDDIQIQVAGTAPVPLSYKIPGNGQLRPKAINATFDGSGAAGAYVPVVEIISDGGVIVARCPISSSVAAGASAEVSWFPGVGGTATKVFPPPPGPGFLIYDYIVTGAAKASIDTAVDGAYAGAFVTSLNILEIWIISRTDYAGVNPYHENLNIQINGDAGNNYDVNYIYGHNAAIVSNFSMGTNAWTVDTHGSGGSANTPGLNSITIPGYADTTFYKVGYESTDLYDTASSVNFWTLRESMGWRSSAAVTRLTVFPFDAGNKLMPGTHLMIYGR